MLCFAAYLRRTRDGKRHAASTHHDRIPIRSVTIDQYISHVASLLIEQCHITSSTLIRSTLLTQLLDGYANWDNADLPLRLRVKIPLTASWPFESSMTFFATSLPADLASVPRCVSGTVSPSAPTSI